MLSKCANPSCSASFLHLAGGRLFRLETETRYPSPNARETRPHRPIVPRFRGNLFYVVQRYRTTAIANGDCHKDLHRSVQIAYFAQRKSPVSFVVLDGVLVYFMTCPTVNRHSPDARHNVLLILSTDIGGAGTVAFRHPR